MLKIILISIVISSPSFLLAGEILNNNNGVLFQQIYFDTIDGTEHHMLPVQIYDRYTGQRNNFATFDLDQFNFEGGSQLDIYVVDWVRDRVLFADTRQVWIPDYHVLDLRSRTIYRPKSNILDQVFGDIFITPNCRYIVYFGTNYDIERETGQNYYQNPNILSTVVIDAETFMEISRLNAFSANMNADNNYFFSDDSLVYIINPFTSRRNKQLVKLHLPSLALLDTLFVNTFCSPPCTEAYIWDVKNDLAVFHVKYSEGDSMGQAIMSASTISKRLLGELPIVAGRQQYPARASSDGQYIVIGTPDNHMIEIFDRRLERLYEIDSIGAWFISSDSLGNDILKISRFNTKIKEDYELSTGRFLRRR